MMMSKTRGALLAAMLAGIVATATAQPVPATDENIPYLVTFGADAPTSWGDDDHMQVFFFVVPEAYTGPVYFRLFDPDCGGAIDESKNGYNTRSTFSLYGGKGAFSHEDARDKDPHGKYDSGNLLASKSFAANPLYDNKWFTFGPFDPVKDGEYVKSLEGNVFKLIAHGVEGDDGNLYRYYLSKSNTSNIPIDEANAFTYEYSFRLSDDPKQVSHIFPFVDERVISIKQSNFDWDGDGWIRLVSVLKRGELVKSSGDNSWSESEHEITEIEHDTSLDIQFVKNKANPVKSNNVVVFVTNQYGQFLPFYTIPIGGVPRPEFNIGARSTPVKK